MPSILRIATMAAALLGASAAQTSPVTFSTVLNGANELPANASAASGLATVDFDLLAHTLRIRIDFSDLSGTSVAAHIHCCTAQPHTGNVGVATATPTFPGFPAGVSAGSYDGLFDSRMADTYSLAFLTTNGGTAAGAEAALFAGLRAQEAYVNIHSTAFPAGEIRGFLQVPEPGSLALLGWGLAGLAFSVRRQQRSAAGKRPQLSKQKHFLP